MSIDPPSPPLSDGVLTLRPWLERDVAAIVSACNDDDIAWWLDGVPHPYGEADGRTYVAASVALPSLELTALQVAVAMAVSSGAPGLEAAVVLGDDPSDEAEDREGLEDREVDAAGSPDGRRG